MKENSENLPDNPEMRELARLQAQMLRPAQNVNRDGSFELGWGIALLCFGVVPYLNAVVAQWTWFSPWVAWIGFLALICAAFAPYAVPKMIKRFITWPRTGYVAYPNDVKLHRWKWFVLPVMLIAPILIVPAIPYPAAQAGIITTWAPLPPVMLCLGTVWLLSGAIALILFMRYNPLPSAATP